MSKGVVNALDNDKEWTAVVTKGSAKVAEKDVNPFTQKVLIGLAAGRQQLQTQRSAFRYPKGNDPTCPTCWRKFDATACGPSDGTCSDYATLLRVRGQCSR